MFSFKIYRNLGIDLIESELPRKPRMQLVLWHHRSRSKRSSGSAYDLICSLQHGSILVQKMFTFVPHWNLWATLTICFLLAVYCIFIWLHKNLLLNNCFSNTGFVQQKGCSSAQKSRFMWYFWFWRKWLNASKVKTSCNFWSVTYWLVLLVSMFRCKGTWVS